MSSQGPNQEGGAKRSHKVMGDLVRPRYSPGLILEDSDLTAAVDYTRDLNRLLFRSLFGCGVVCGLTVGVKNEEGAGDLDLEVTIAAGLALDGCGDPIQLASPVTVRLGRQHQVLRQSADQAGPQRRNFWVVLRGGEQHCTPRELVCDADELESLSQSTRTRATAEVSIEFDRPKCLCQCGPGPELEGKDPTAHFDAVTAELFPAPPAPRPEPSDCHKQHRERTDCAPDGGCGAGCECGCCVLLARVHWFKDQRAWGPIHVGERRFLRPTFGRDPMTDQRPPASAAVPQAGGAGG